MPNGQSENITTERWVGPLERERIDNLRQPEAVAATLEPPEYPLAEPPIKPFEPLPAPKEPQFTDVQQQVLRRVGIGDPLEGLTFLDTMFKTFAAAVTAPFREGAVPETEPSVEAALFSWLPGGEGYERYEAAELPQIKTGRYYPEALGGEEITLGVKGAVELLPWLFVGGGGARGVKLFKEADKIAVKQAKGKAITGAEQKILAEAVAEEAKISASMRAKAPLARMPSIQELIDANFAPNRMAVLGTKFTKAPGIVGSLARRLLPMQVAKTNAERATIAWAEQRGIAPSLAKIEMDIVYAKDVPFRLDAAGLAKNIKPKDPRYKPHIGAIHEFPDRYILTQAQRAEIDLMDSILQKQLAREIEAGVKVFPTPLKPGQRYFPRFVKELVDLETQAVTEIKRGVTTRPGVLPSSFRERYYQEILEGITAGKRYTTDIRAAVEMRLAAGNKAISDRMLADYLSPLGRLPKDIISLKLAAGKAEIISKRTALKQISELIEHINAGAKIEWYRWLGIKKQYPTQYAELRATSKANQPVSTELKKFIVAGKKNLTQTSKDILANYRKEMKRARKPVLGKEGAINHAGLQGRLFPIDISEPTNALITKEISSSQVLNQINKVNAVARMGQTAIDTGFTLIQGLLTLANAPKAWGSAFAQTMKTLVNPKYTVKWNTIPEHAAARRVIATHGGAPFGGTEFTEAARAGGWFEKIPGVGKVFVRFGRAFEDYIDTARTLILEAKIPHYTRKLGRELTDKELTDLVVTSDHMVGISSLQRLGIANVDRQWLNTLLYAPRYYSAYVSFLGRAFQGGIGGDMARKALVKFSVAVPTFMTAIAYSLGQEYRVLPTKERPIPIMFDPRTGEFLTVEIAGTHMGLGGVWIAGFRLLGSLVRTAQDDPTDFLSLDPHENPILRYFYGRGSPVVTGAIDIFTGRNYLGERLDTPSDYLKEVVDKTFPFWVAGAITDVPKAGWEKGLAEWWGLRAWMVQYREMARQHAEDHIKDLPNETIMAWQREKGIGKLTYDDLTNEQRGWLLLNYEDFREAEEKRLAEKLEKGTDFEVADIKAREMLDTAYNADLAENAEAVIAGQISVWDYQQRARDLRRANWGTGYQTYRQAMRLYLDESRWEDLERWIEENQKPEDKAYDKYREVRDEVPNIQTEESWKAWRESVNSYLSGLNAETRQYIERRSEYWINNLPLPARQIQRLILDSTPALDAYYEVPSGKARTDYRELNADTDARLFLLGRVSRLQSLLAYNLASQLAIKYGLEAQILKPTGLESIPSGAIAPGHTSPLERERIK